MDEHPFDEERARALAERIVDAFAREDFDAIYATFDENMRKAIGVDEIARVWREQARNFGPFVRAHDSIIDRKKRHFTVFVRCEFEKRFGFVHVAVMEDGRIGGLHLREAPPPGQAASAPKGVMRALWLAAPLILAVPVAYGFVARAMGAELFPRGIIEGTLGWMLALALRAPVALAARRFAPAKMSTIVVGSSGPLEETVRVFIVIAGTRSLSAAFSIGLGWASIEVLYALVSGIATVRMAAGDDAHSAIAREQIAAAGGRAPAGPFIGIIERVSASAFHIGATMLVARYPIVVLGLIPAHSGLNFAAVKLIARSMTLGQAFTAVVGGVAFVAGAVAWRAI